ncbi:unnamed protein product [Heterobilharzia americana]|nr:unnamed protein product [Heterobilharzia americana]
MELNNGLRYFVTLLEILLPHSSALIPEFICIANLCVTALISLKCLNKLEKFMTRSGNLPRPEEYSK